jgi:hypothetical protein
VTVLVAVNLSDADVDAAFANFKGDIERTARLLIVLGSLQSVLHYG